MFFIKNAFKSKAGHKTAMAVKKIISPLYKKLNTAELEKQPINEADISFLKNAYSNEKQNLENLYYLHLQKQTPVPHLLDF